MTLDPVEPFNGGEKILALLSFDGRWEFKFNTLRARRDKPPPVLGRVAFQGEESPE